MSKRSFMTIDIIFFTLLACILDAINLYAFKMFPFNGYSLTLHITLALLVMIRWGYHGVIVAFIGGITYCLFAGNFQLDIILTYGVGNLLIVLNLIYFKIIKKKQLIKNNLYLTLYIISGYILISLGRGVVYSLISGNFKFYSIYYFIYELFNLVIGIIIIFIARRQNGIVEDMNDYLIRIHQDSLLKETSKGSVSNG